MKTKRQLFYGQSSLKFYNREDIINGRVIKINPAIITILDKLHKSLDIDLIQEKVLVEVETLLKTGNIYTIHVDINFKDYNNFGNNGPAVNSHIFNVNFLERLSKLTESYSVFLNIHLLTDYPKVHIMDIKHIKIGAICFQMEVVKDSKELGEIVDEISKIGACASPVIEVIGTEKFVPKTKEEAFKFISPFQDKIDMLTFQVETTGARSSSSLGLLASNEVTDYISFFKNNFNGTIQIQGGITTKSMGLAVKLGGEFLVCGTEIFNNKFGYSSIEVIENMLEQAAKALFI